MQDRAKKLQKRKGERGLETHRQPAESPGFYSSRQQQEKPAKGCRVKPVALWFITLWRGLMQHGKLSSPIPSVPRTETLGSWKALQNHGLSWGQTGALGTQASLKNSHWQGLSSLQHLPSGMASKAGIHAAPARIRVSRSLLIKEKRLLFLVLSALGC